MAANSENQPKPPKKGGAGKPFAPGVSGNPSGRPKILQEVIDLARQHTEAAMLTLASIASDAEKPTAARVSAATALLDRGWGKPVQPTMEQDETGKAVGRPIIVFGVMK